MKGTPRTPEPRWGQLASPLIGLGVVVESILNVNKELCEGTSGVKLQGTVVRNKPRGHPVRNYLYFWTWGCTMSAQRRPNTLEGGLAANFIAVTCCFCHGTCCSELVWSSMYRSRQAWYLLMPFSSNMTARTKLPSLPVDAVGTHRALANCLFGPPQYISAA